MARASPHNSIPLAPPHNAHLGPHAVESALGTLCPLSHKLRPRTPFRIPRRLDFALELDGAESTATVTYVLTDARPDGFWPVLVFFSGLCGHRLIAAMIEGIAHAHRIQIITLDKPGAGGSACDVALPLTARTRWMHTALLAVLAHTHIALFYALYTLLHLPSTFTATSWTLSGPFVSQIISGSVGLRFGATLPAPLPSALGWLLQLVPPIARAASWIGGVLSASAAGDKDGAAQAGAPARVLHRHVNSACRAGIMRVGIADSAEGEAHSVWRLGAGTDDATVLRGTFARLAERYADDALRIRVVYISADRMKGRAWLRGELEDTHGRCRRVDGGAVGGGAQQRAVP
ncbi:hypothetical protein FB451DRAFT_1570499 [Mycena latifolia]|nr:hypothetical protein FB451DRAFT_1570499 [Mycena latifolia]